MADNKVDVGDHGGPFSPGGSQGKSPAASSGERTAGKSRRRQSSPVLSVNGSQGLPTRGNRSHTISASIPPSSRIFANTSTPTTQQAPPMAPGKGGITNGSHDLVGILREIEPRGGVLADGFWHAPDLPPITADTLSELDMPRIINNPKLRHDVNFDRELHFRPNLDGSKGKQKLDSAELYWKALEAELYMCAHIQVQKASPDFADKDEEHWQGLLSASLRRLPKIFEAVGDILKTLVPDGDLQAITERLDVTLIMREISHGVCDLVDLANWLAKVLKNHCAPMRDELVNRMQREIIRGATEQKPAKLVNGLKQLLAILEAMKLDVANHQIRHMRSVLIEDTVNFQNHFNNHRIKTGKIDVTRAKVWLDVEMGHLSTETDTPTPLEGMVSALLRSLLFCDYSTMFPTTFYLDVERLKSLRIDMQTCICHEICRDVLTEMVGSRASRTELPRAVSGLYHTVTAITGITGNFALHLENIAVEIMRIALLLEGRHHGTYDPVLLDAIEQRLETDLQPCSMAFERYATELIERLLPKVQANVDQHVKLPTLHLQDKLVPPINTPLVTHQLAYGAVCSPVMPPQHSDPDEEFVRRFTHVAALHWQVWADLVYLVPLDDLEAAASTGSRTPPASPTVPIAQAVYAPGHKWLPVGVTVTEVPTGLLSPAPSPRPQSQKPDSEPEPGTSAFDAKQRQQSA